MGYRLVTTSTTTPAPTALTGTVTVDSGQSNYLIGTATLFTDEIASNKQNLWVWIPNVSELIKVKGVISDTTLVLWENSTANADPIYLVDVTQVRRIEIDNIGNGTATIDGVNLPTGQKRIFEYDAKYGYVKEPHRIDGSTSNLSVIEE